MRSKTFGLDIGSSSIKAVWLKRENDSLLIESISTFRPPQEAKGSGLPAPFRGLLSESILDQKELGNLIKKVVDSAGIQINLVNVSIPEGQVYSKIVEMPELSERELQAALIWEIERHIPLPIDQVKTDWQILGRKEVNGKKTMEVLIVASSIGVLEKYEKILEYAGLSPQSMETEMISVHRSLLPALNENGADMIIHLGASTTDVIITSGKSIAVAFPIPLGGIAITRAISIDFGVDITQAESFKRAYGLSREVFEGKIGKALGPILESIVSDITKGMLLFREKNSFSNIKQIILSGGNALLPGIDVFFANTFGMELQIANPWQLYNIKNTPQKVLDAAPDYSVVLGLALRDVL